MAIHSTKIFSTLFWIAQLLAVLIVVLVIVWGNNYLGGFAWQEDPLHELNYHILFTVIGQVILFGDGLLIYRAMRYKPKKILKILHGSIFALAFISTVVSLKAAFDSHSLRKNPIPNMYSIHSWTGLGTVILFSMQLCGGFFAFVYPGSKYRKEYFPLHRFFGIMIFILSVVTCHSGIMGKVKSAVGKDYRDLPPAAMVGNFLGVTIALFATIVIYLVTMPEYQRKPLPEENSVNVEMTHGYGQF